MFHPDEERELRALVERVAGGSTDRRDWSTLAALLLIGQGNDACRAIAAEGLDTFIHRSEPIYVGHAFQFDDYARIYDRICAHVR